MPWKEREEGEVAGATGVHALPLNVQVSARSVPLLPPKRIVWVWPESYAMAWPWRGEGPAPTGVWVHELPLKSQPSLSREVPAALPFPPNRNSSPRLPWYTIAPLCRAGGLVLSEKKTNWSPNHSQRSFCTPLPSLPPKIAPVVPYIAPMAL